MLCFFMFFLMTVSSAPLGLVHGKQESKHVAEIMSHPRLSQALFQNKTFLSELAEADPGTLNTILGLLNDLLSVSEAASRAFNTDVIAALTDKNAKSVILATATSTQDWCGNAKTAADLALEVAQGAVTEANGQFDTAVLHHTAMVDELNDKQPGVDAESETLRSTILLVESLIPAPDCSCYGPTAKWIRCNNCCNNYRNNEMGCATMFANTEFCPYGHNVTDAVAKNSRYAAACPYGWTA